MSRMYIRAQGKSFMKRASAGVCVLLAPELEIFPIERHGEISQSESANQKSGSGAKVHTA